MLIAVILFIIFGIIALHQFFTVQKAHSNFENYYAFRDCKQLVTKTDTYGTCKLSDGKIIKIVKFNNKWYLDNDLPFCIGTFCL